MATTSYGTPYVQSSDLVSGWPTASLNVANRIDEVSYAGNGINAQTGTSYTLAVTDAGKLVTLNNAAAVAVSLPQDSTANLPVGSVTRIYNLGAGLVTVQAGAGATLQGGSVTVAQYDACDVTKLSANTYGIAAKAALSQLKIRQIVNGSYSTTVTVSSTTYTDTGLSATITPTSASNSILVIAFQQFYIKRSSTAASHGLRLLRGATAVFSPDTNKEEAGYIYVAGVTAVEMAGRTPLMYLDSPATTSATTYKLQGAATTTANSGSVVYQMGNSTSSILLIEVAP